MTYYKKRQSYSSGFIFQSPEQYFKTDCVTIVIVQTNFNCRAYQILYKITQLFLVHYILFQKVEYTGVDQKTNTMYHQVTRSCSQGVCLDRSDNCTGSAITNPGCMERRCCYTSLCNMGEKVGLTIAHMLCFICLTIYNWFE